jgi:hypothetical protein
MDIIWYSRNNLAHDDSKPDIPAILRQICSAFRAHRNAWVNSSLNHDAWKPPTPGRLKVNFTVAIRKSFVVATAVLNNDQGQILSTIVECLPLQDVNARKPLAALLALKFAASWGIKHLLLEGGSKPPWWLPWLLTTQPHLRLTNIPYYL